MFGLLFKNQKYNFLQKLNLKGSFNREMWIYIQFVYVPCSIGTQYLTRELPEQYQCGVAWKRSAQDALIPTLRSFAFLRLVSVVFLLTIHNGFSMEFRGVC